MWGDRVRGGGKGEEGGSLRLCGKPILDTRGICGEGPTPLRLGERVSELEGGEGQGHPGPVLIFW